MCWIAYCNKYTLTQLLWVKRTSALVKSTKQVKTSFSFLLSCWRIHSHTPAAELKLSHKLFKPGTQILLSITLHLPDCPPFMVRCCLNSSG